MMRSALPLLVLVLLLGSAGLVALAETAPPPDGFVLDGDAARGRELFAKRCAVCHGDNGDGQGRVRTKPPARDLRDPARMDPRTDWQIYLAIRDGGEAIGLSPTMIAWGSLVDDQALHDLAVFVRSLSKPPEAASGETEGDAP